MNAWQIPAWAEQAMFDHDGRSMTCYSTESDAKRAYITAFSEMSTDGQQVNLDPRVVIAIGDGSIEFQPESAAHIQRLILDLLDVVKIWKAHIEAPAPRPHASDPETVRTVRRRAGTDEALRLIDGL